MASRLWFPARPRVLDGQLLKTGLARVKGLNRPPKVLNLRQRLSRHRLQRPRGADAAWCEHAPTLDRPTRLLRFLDDLCINS
jgi:hypothetical protein